MSEPKLYPFSHPIDAEPYYSRHVEAMTVEELHSKAAIALQLAVRDKEIARLSAKLAEIDTEEVVKIIEDGECFARRESKMDALKQSNAEKQAEIDRLLVAVAKQSVRLAGNKPDCAALATKIYDVLDHFNENGNIDFNCDPAFGKQEINRVLEAEL